MMVRGNASQQDSNIDSRVIDEKEDPLEIDNDDYPAEKPSLSCMKNDLPSLSCLKNDFFLYKDFPYWRSNFSI